MSEPQDQEKPTSENTSSGATGLGDVIETIAKPVASMLGIKDCAPCRRRKEKLNAISQAASLRAAAFGRRIFRKKTQVR